MRHSRFTEQPDRASLSPTDEELMLRYREGRDAHAFDELVHRRAPELTRYLRRIAGRSAADDLLQATFLHVHRRRATYEPGRPVMAWLYSIATHLAIDWLRQAAHHRTVSLEQTPAGSSDDDGRPTLGETLPNAAPGPVVLAENHEAEDWAVHALEELPADLRLAVELVHLQGASYAEAAERLGVPVGTVKSRVHLAIERLRKARQRLRSSDGAPVQGTVSGEFSESDPAPPNLANSNRPTT